RERYGASPSPCGRRWREAPDEGSPPPRYIRFLAQLVGADCPHPALRATLSRRERAPPETGLESYNSARSCTVPEFAANTSLAIWTDVVIDRAYKLTTS